MLDRKGCWSLCYGSAEAPFISFFDSRWLEYPLSWPTVCGDMYPHSDATMPWSCTVGEYHDYRSFPIVDFASNVTFDLA